jgi:hypothetical protein
MDRLSDVVGLLFLVGFIASGVGFAIWYVRFSRRVSQAQRAQAVGDAEHRGIRAAPVPLGWSDLSGCLAPLLGAVVWGGTVLGAIYLFVRFIRWAWDTPIAR